MLLPVPRNDISVKHFFWKHPPQAHSPLWSRYQPCALTPTGTNSPVCMPSKDVLVKHQEFSDLHKLKWKSPQQTAASTSDQAEIRQGAAGLGSKGSAYEYGVGDDCKSNVMAMT
ncbi:uncharacterized protein LOC135346513 [Halichondria panicea]|uniref:uncharacterized protein LOC135346513 n=1 Tax=Halichondria panicea TaxID=6063 RepID=UPI00312B3666